MLTMKFLTQLVLVAGVCFLTMAAEATEQDSRHRELYAECRENGRFVPMGTSCCHETTDVHYRMALDTSSSSNGRCDQINFGDLMVMFDTYCGRRRESAQGSSSPHHNSDLQCTYDVQQHNPDCADQLRQTCEAHGGTLYASDVVLECEQFNPPIRVLNSLTCLGVSCDDHDVQEYMWAAPDLTNYGLGTCKITHVHDQTLKSFQQQDVRERAFIVGIFLCAVLVLGVFFKVWSAQRFRRKNVWVPSSDISSDDIPTEITKEPLPPSDEEISPLHGDEEDETVSSNDPLDPLDSGSVEELNLKDSPKMADVKAMEGELA